MKNAWLNGIMGVVVGDVLGLPVEFSCREKLQENPVINMMDVTALGYPKGSWSDDSKYSNGSGPLMRILPACLCIYMQEQRKEVTMIEAMEQIHKSSSLTYEHLRSKIARGIYYQMAKSVLLHNGTLIECLQHAVDEAIHFYHLDKQNLDELPKYERIFDIMSFARLPETSIKSRGYVVDTLEAVVWSLVTTDSSGEGVLKAVNLGGDTDTIGSITGGLAALFYGYDGIPEKWLHAVVRKEYIAILRLMTNEKLEIE